MKPLKIYVPDLRHPSYDIEKEILEEIGGKLYLRQCSSGDEVKTILKNADAVLLDQLRFDEEIIRELSSCKIISRYGAGYDNLDVTACKQFGITAANVPDYCSDDVSEHVFGLLFSLIRHIPVRNERVKSGLWNSGTGDDVSRLKGKTFGIIGFGRTAKSLIQKLGGFGLSKIQVYSPRYEYDEVRAYGVAVSSFEDLLKTSDYISIHASLNPGSYHLFNRKAFSMMKKNVLLINTARGSVIDEKALALALEKGRIAGAGLDVFENEPPGHDHPLLKFSNVLLTDHCAFFSRESIVELKTKAARNITEFYKTGSPLYPL